MKTLPVYCGKRLVAALEQSGAGVYALTYDDAWIRDGFDVSVNLPRTQKRHAGDAVRIFFENMLPEGAIRAALARQYGVSRQNVFGLLARIGRDCAGAFSLGEPQREGDYRPVSPAKLKELLESLPANPMATRQRGTSLSLAGAQDKLPLLVKDGAFYLPVYGAASNCIVKLPLRDFPHSVDNEHFCMHLARAAGLPAAPTDIHHLPGMDVLVVERYDREGAGFHPQRLAQEDFCQLAGVSSELKYESDGGPAFADCAALIRRHSMQAGRDLLLLMRWAAFNLCIGNNDAHAKNISMLRNGSRLMLSPFYDLISTTFYGHRLPRKLAMKIGGNSKSYYVSRNRWERFAEDVTLPPATVLKGVAAMANAILAATPRAEESALAAGTPPAVAAKLRLHIDSRAQSVLSQLTTAKRKSS